MTRFLVMAGWLAASLPAWSMTGDEIMAAMDEATNRHDDQFFKYEVRNKEPSAKEPKSMVFTTQLKGKKSLTEFLSPGDIKGTRVLVLSRTQMYIFLPQFNKIRRVASHATEMGFMGTTLTNDDMATLAYGDLYNVTVESEDDAQWVLTATAKAPDDVVWANMKFTVIKESFLPTKIEYVNEKGEVARTMDRSEYTCEGNICTARVMRMTDHSRGEAWTELIRTEWNVNQGVDDGLFSVRELQRGQ